MEMPPADVDMETPQLDDDEDPAPQITIHDEWMKKPDNGAELLFVIGDLGATEEVLADERLWLSDLEIDEEDGIIEMRKRIQIIVDNWHHGGAYWLIRFLTPKHPELDLAEIYNDYCLDNNINPTSLDVYSVTTALELLSHELTVACVPLSAADKSLAARLQAHEREIDGKSITAIVRGDDYVDFALPGERVSWEDVEQKAGDWELAVNRVPERWFDNELKPRDETNLFEAAQLTAWAEEDLEESFTTFMVRMAQTGTSTSPMQF